MLWRQQMSKYGKEKRQSADDIETVGSSYTNAKYVNVDVLP